MSFVAPLLKKPSLDKEILSKYRSIQNLSLISKLTERAVKTRLIGHLMSNHLLNHNQSAYTKKHLSIETTTFSLHHHLPNAIPTNKFPVVVCLISLLHLIILISPLSFIASPPGSACDIVLAWFPSYQASCRLIFRPLFLQCFITLWNSLPPRIIYASTFPFCKTLSPPISCYHSQPIPHTLKLIFFSFSYRPYLSILPSASTGHQSASIARRWLNAGEYLHLL